MKIKSGLLKALSLSHTYMYIYTQNIYSTHTHMEKEIMYENQETIKYIDFVTFNPLKVTVLS